MHFSVGTEGVLVCSIKQFCRADPCSQRVQGLHRLVTSGGEMRSGIPLQVLSPSLLLYTGASMTGWDSHLQYLTAARVWSKEERELHINVLEMKAVQLAWNAFLSRILGELVALMNNNASLVTYLKKQGGTVSRVMCSLAQDIMA